MLATMHQPTRQQHVSKQKPPSDKCSVVDRWSLMTEILLVTNCPEHHQYEAGSALLNASAIVPLITCCLVCCCRDYGGIGADAYDKLNPLALCGIFEVAPLVCVGDKFASCSNIYRTVEGDTCSRIEATVGTIVGGKINCPAPKPHMPVCVRRGPNQVSVLEGHCTPLEPRNRPAHPPPASRLSVTARATCAPSAAHADARSACCTCAV